MMSFRVVCLLAAVFTYAFSMWLAVAFVIAGAILPWWAVVLANDGPPRKRRPPLMRANPHHDQALPGAGPDRTIDG